MKRRLLLAAPLLAVSGLLGFFFGRMDRAYAGFRGQVFVDIPQGTSTLRIADLLESSSVVASRWMFLAARATMGRVTLQAGEYRFSEPATPRMVLARLARGDVFYHELVVPEGYSLFDIAESLDKLGIIGAPAFLEAARKPDMIRDLAPAALTLEGYLYPSTYRLTRHATAERLCRMMTGQFRKTWNGLQRSGTLTPHETVTLASLIEKETARPEERPLIASVFHNRLRMGMALQCDPTTIYAARIDGRWRGAIHQSDLASANPYNTYQRAGLPPGPIANPGALALTAAMEPAHTDYLYFVARADSSGGHEFSSTVTAHQRAVARYRRGQKTEHARATAGAR